MRILTVEVADRDTVDHRFKRAMGGERQGEFLTFTSLELLYQVLSPRRWQILQYLQEHGPVGLRALAGELGMDASDLQRDVEILKAYGLIVDRAGNLTVPYDEIRLELVVRKVA